MSTSLLPATEDALGSVGARTYVVKTLGCQMNVHDSEHMAGMLEQAGYVAASPADAAAEDADVIVINTCAVRENAADKLYGNLGRLAGSKRARPGMQIAVGGCLAQKDRAGIVERAPWVDVVFGTHNLDVLPVLLERARHNAEAQVEIEESLKVFPSTLPTRRESVYAGWVSISVGCNNTCTFCIVPHLRGKERDRRPGEILAEVEALVGQGAVEVTLLGQNVNSYGVGFGDRGAFAKLLRAAGAIDGLERLRFTSPHPAAFTDDVIEAMAQTPTVMPQLHMPLQSGSDRILRAMRRSYRSDKFLGILDRVREAMPDAAITTDIIVGFPGETEEDFEETLRVVEASRFASAFTFQYSPRPGTAGVRPARRAAEVRRPGALRPARRPAGPHLARGEPEAGRADRRGAGRRGRGPQGRRVAPAHRPRRGQPPGAPRAARGGGPVPRPGDLVSVDVTYAAPYHLVADSALPRRTAGSRSGAPGPGTPGTGVPTTTTATAVRATRAVPADRRSVPVVARPARRSASCPGRPAA